MTTPDIPTLVAEAERTSGEAATPEDAIHAIVQVFHANLGDRDAHRKPDALLPGQSQFFVGGAFMVTPDRANLMLIGNIGFPADQRRLLVPIDGGNPGQVIATGKPLLIEDTTTRADFRQYLSTSRMSSAIYAPLALSGRTIGLIIMAAQARWTFGTADLNALTALIPAAEAAWHRLDGARWLDSEYQTQLPAAGARPQG
jgi:hypothetical protein